jgi:hypothetical protein
MTNKDLFKFSSYDGSGMAELGMAMLESHGEGFESLANNKGDADTELCRAIIQDCITHISASQAILSLVARRLNPDEPLIAIQHALGLMSNMHERAEYATTQTIMSFDKTIETVKAEINESGVTH